MICVHCTHCGVLRSSEIIFRHPESCRGISSLFYTLCKGRDALRKQHSALFLAKAREEAMLQADRLRVVKRCGEGDFQKIHHSVLATLVRNQASFARSQSSLKDVKCFALGDVSTQLDMTVLFSIRHRALSSSCTVGPRRALANSEVSRGISSASSRSEHCILCKGGSIAAQAGMVDFIIKSERDTITAHKVSNFTVP